jgi:phenylalanyl-tRNA synthetase beta chain
VPVEDVCWLDGSEMAALMVDGKCLGVLGRFHPEVEEDLKLKQKVYAAEIDFQSLLPYLFMPVKFEPLIRFPSMERDISIVVPLDVGYGAIQEGILGLGIQELAALDLVDVYEGNPIAEGKVSLTVRLVFLDREGTLTVDRVQGFSDNIRSFLRDRFGAENR